MKRSGRLIIIGLLGMFVVCSPSCKRKTVSLAGLIAYVNDPENGLQKTQQTGKIKTVLTYKPWQTMMFNEGGLNNKDRRSDSLKFQDKLFFVFSLSANNKELLKQLEFSQYSEMVQVLAFRMKNFIDVVPDDGKPVEPTDCIFQQTYGMGVANNLLVVFDKEKLMTADNLKFEVREFGLNTGNLNFGIKTKDITDIPALAQK
ncbi:hypothetical protein ACFGVS_10865 [Mucilaginibacter sp. AW1-7]|uniref:hypothetical protein n=1 Tax=Mucilaginibacter sp. AW1-7 TaxID=3349874 RepID=UPI003F734BF5